MCREESRRGSEFKKDLEVRGKWQTQKGKGKREGNEKGEGRRKVEGGK